MTVVYYLIGVFGGALGVAVDPWFGVLSAAIGFCVERYAERAR